MRNLLGALIKTNTPVQFLINRYESSRICPGYANPHLRSPLPPSPCLSRAHQIYLGQEEGEATAKAMEKTLAPWQSIHQRWGARDLPNVIEPQLLSSLFIGREKCSVTFNIKKG